jgi:hypothetical protein
MIYAATNHNETRLWNSMHKQFERLNKVCVSLHYLKTPNIPNHELLIRKAMGQTKSAPPFLIWTEPMRVETVLKHTPLLRAKSPLFMLAAALVRTIDDLLGNRRQRYIATNHRSGEKTPMMIVVEPSSNIPQKRNHMAPCSERERAYHVGVVHPCLYQIKPSTKKCRAHPGDSLNEAP